MRKDVAALVKEAASSETLDLSAFHWQSNTLERRTNKVDSAVDQRQDKEAIYVGLVILEFE